MKDKSKKIKSRNAKTNKIDVSAIKSFTTDYPLFCFKHLQTKPDNDYKFYADFFQRLKMLSNTTWKIIETSDKHGVGTEKIPIDKIKPQLPQFVTPDITHLTVFRANGDNRPFLGIRNEHVFHIIFLEEKFNAIYNHGKKK